MSGMVKKLGVIVMALGFIGLVIGLIFAYQGFSKQNEIVSKMVSENISMAAFGGKPTEIIDNMDKAQIAGDTIRQHRHSIAPTYGELLGNSKYDPTNPVQVTYAQAINLENYLYLGVTALGLTEVVLGNSAFMVIASLGMIIIGFAFIKMKK
jgi:hypothetical protein